MSCRSILILIELLSAVVIASTVGAQLPVIRIGVVVDGPYERNQEMVEAFREEILTLTRGEFDVRFPEDIYVEGDWTEAGIKSSLDRLLEDPSVDLVFAMGVIVGDMVCRYLETFCLTRFPDLSPTIALLPMGSPAMAPVEVRISGLRTRQRCKGRARDDPRCQEYS